MSKRDTPRDGAVLVEVKGLEEAVGLLESYREPQLVQRPRKFRPAQPARLVRVPLLKRLNETTKVSSGVSMRSGSTTKRKRQTAAQNMKNRNPLAIRNKKETESVKEN